LRDIGRSSLVLDQFADAFGIIGLVGQHDGARPEVIQQRIGNLTVMPLLSGQAASDLEPPRVDDDVDLGREAAS
jgi:hypothetical protein